MIAIEIRLVDLLLTLPLAVSMIGVEVRMMDLPLVLPLAVDIVGAEVRVMPFPLTLLMELGVVTLVESLAGTCVMTEPNLVVMALFVGEAGEFLRT